MAQPERPTDPDDSARRARDDALLADLAAPPTVREARESRDFWQQRLSQLSMLKRAERKEAEEMTATWERRLREAERQQYGPGLLEQLLQILGVRWRPSPRRLIAGLGVFALLTVMIIIALVIAIVAFWPQIAPIIQVFSGGGSGGD